MEKLFKLSQRGTDVKTEVIAGLTTFMTMAYVWRYSPRLSAEAMRRSLMSTASSSANLQ